MNSFYNRPNPSEDDLSDDTEAVELPASGVVRVSKEELDRLRKPGGPPSPEYSFFAPSGDELAAYELRPREDELGAEPQLPAGDSPAAQLAPKPDEFAKAELIALARQATLPTRFGSVDRRVIAELLATRDRTALAEPSAGSDQSRKAELFARSSAAAVPAVDASSGDLEAADRVARSSAAAATAFDASSGDLETADPVARSSAAAATAFDASIDDPETADPGACSSAAAATAFDASIGDPDTADPGARRSAAAVPAVDASSGDLVSGEPFARSSASAVAAFDASIGDLETADPFARRSASAHTEFAAAFDAPATAELLERSHTESDAESDASVHELETAELFERGHATPDASVDELETARLFARHNAAADAEFDAIMDELSPAQRFASRGDAGVAGADARGDEPAAAELTRTDERGLEDLSAAPDGAAARFVPSGDEALAELVARFDELASARLDTPADEVPRERIAARRSEAVGAQSLATHDGLGAGGQTSHGEHPVFVEDLAANDLASHGDPPAGEHLALSVDALFAKVFVPSADAQARALRPADSSQRSSSLGERDSSGVHPTTAQELGLTTQPSTWNALVALALQARGPAEQPSHERGPVAWPPAQAPRADLQPTSGISPWPAAQDSIETASGSHQPGSERTAPTTSAAPDPDTIVHPGSPGLASSTDLFANAHRVQHNEHNVSDANARGAGPSHLAGAPPVPALELPHGTDHAELLDEPLIITVEPVALEDAASSPDLTHTMHAVSPLEPANAVDSANPSESSSTVDFASTLESVSAVQAASAQPALDATRSDPSDSALPALPPTAPAPTAAAFPARNSLRIPLVLAVTFATLALVNTNAFELQSITVRNENSQYAQTRRNVGFIGIDIERVAAELDKRISPDEPVALAPPLAGSALLAQRFPEALYPRRIEKTAKYQLTLDPAPGSVLLDGRVHLLGPATAATLTPRPSQALACDLARAALLMLSLLGFAATLLLIARRLPAIGAHIAAWPALVQLSASVLAACGALGVAASAATLLGLDLHFQILPVAGLVLLPIATLVALIPRLRKPSTRAELPAALARAVRQPELWFGGALIALALRFVYMAPILLWDARSVWFFLGKQLALQGRLLPTDAALYSWAHPEYPLLYPSLLAFFSGLGPWDERQAAVGLVALFVSSLALLYFLARPLLGRAAAAAFVLIPWAYLFQNSLSGYADGFVVLAMLVGLLGFYRPKTEAIGWLGVCCAALIKREGLVFGLVAAGLHTVLGEAPRARSWLRRLAPFAGFIPPVLHSQWAKRSGVTGDFGNAQLPQGAALWTRIEAIWDALRALPWGRGPAMIGLVGLVLSLLYLRSARRRPGGLVAAGTGIAGLAFIYLAFTITPFDLRWHIQTALDRLVLQVALILATAGVLIVAAEDERLQRQPSEKA